MTGSPNIGPSRPAVSVVMPFLNGIGFLPDAVDSVLTQQYPDCELLLVDDGSSDGSSELARDYARAFPARVRYLDHAGHANLGKSTSRNLGIREARGDRLVFLDVDDVLLPDKVAWQVASLEAHPTVVMAYGTTQWWYSWDDGRPLFQRDRIPPQAAATGRAYEPPGLLTAYLNDPGTVPCICALLVRTDVVRAVGGFDESIQDLYEDQVLIAKLVLAGPVYVDGHCGERYRQHAGSTSAAAIAANRYHPRRANEAHRRYLEWLDGYVAGQKLTDAALHRALAKARAPYLRSSS